MSAPELPELPPLAVVGVLRSPWKEKFSIPRQSGLAEAVEATLELDPARIPAEALRGLEGASHLWLIGWFHAVADQGWRPTVRPPRLGGSARLGVFATRAPHRPNPLSLSLVELVAVDAPSRTVLVRGADLLDGTPILDIKPYLPWAEARPEARCEWAPAPPARLELGFAPAAEATLATLPDPAGVRLVIEQSLRFDPRPAHQRETEGRRYAAALLDLDVEFRVDAGRVEVTDIRPRPIP